VPGTRKNFVARDSDQHRSSVSAQVSNAGVIGEVGPNPEAGLPGKCRRTKINLLRNATYIETGMLFYEQLREGDTQEVVLFLTR